jgi:hypothetical protein
MTPTSLLPNRGRVGIDFGELCERSSAATLPLHLARGRA